MYSKQQLHVHYSVDCNVIILTIQTYILLVI